MAQAARSTSQGGGADRDDADQPAGAGEDLGHDLKSAARELRSAAKEQGRALYETAKSEATTFADQRKNDAAQSVSDIAATLRDAGESLGERPNIRAFVGGAADGLDTFADGLRDRSFADIYGDVEAYARRSPMVVGAAALAAGFLLARFIKSTSDDLSAQAREARVPVRRARRQSGPDDDA